MEMIKSPLSISLVRTLGLQKRSDWPKVILPALGLYGKCHSLSVASALQTVREVFVEPESRQGKQLSRPKEALDLKLALLTKRK